MHEYHWQPNTPQHDATATVLDGWSSVPVIVAKQLSETTEPSSRGHAARPCGSLQTSVVWILEQGLLPQSVCGDVKLAPLWAVMLMFLQFPAPGRLQSQWFWVVPEYPNQSVTGISIT